MKKTIITISRQFGSGGRSVGRMVAEKLGISVADVNVREAAALSQLREKN